MRVREQGLEHLRGEGREHQQQDRQPRDFDDRAAAFVAPTVAGWAWANGAALPDSSRTAIR